jgi:hypothetical protein
MDGSIVDRQNSWGAVVMEFLRYGSFWLGKKC